MASEAAPLKARGHVRLHALAIGALAIVVIGAVATLFGWDISGWFKEIWHTIKTISIGYLLAAIALITLQTVTAAFAWYSILRFGYPSSNVRWHEVLACYAAAVALNFILPANLGTLVMLIMFTTLIATATFAGVLGGYVVQKVFFTAMGIVVYLYLFLSVGGSFSLQFGFVESHPIAAAIVLVGGLSLLIMVGRLIKPRLVKWWQDAKEGGEIVTHPRLYLGRVLLPEAISWIATLGIIAVFLAAYGIPVTFDTLMRVMGGNSLANMTAATPGGAGVVQGFNVLSLKGVTSASNATAYSVSQQLVSTVWSIVLAIALMTRAFGWSDGKTLVERSYSEAKQKSADEAAARKARRQSRRERAARERLDQSSGGT